MLASLRQFSCDESGAITVDWVVLSAALIGLGMVVMGPVAFETTSSTRAISTDIKNTHVGYENR